jgi:branched-chain amino acid transport system substrate-binding protein
MKRELLHYRALTIALGLALVAWSAVRPDPAAADVKIGVLLPLSGKGASYGQHQEIAVKMALDELEKTGIKGEPVKVFTYDTRGDNTEAINLTRKLIHTDNVLMVVGPFFSAECEVAFPIAVQGRTPIVTASSAKPGIAAKNRPWAFRNALTSDRMNGPLIDKWIAVNGGQMKSVVILTDVKDAFTKSDGTQVFPAVQKAKHVEILDNISFQAGDIDFSAQVTKLKSLNPDGIVIAANYNEGGNIVREIRKQGLKQPIVGALGIADTKFLEIAGPASEGVMGVMPFWPDNPDPRVRAWVEAYRKRANTTPGNTDALIYDTLFIAKQCIESSGVTNKPSDLAADRERIRSCLEKVKDYPGIVGATTFNADGDAVLAPVPLRARDGRWEYLK